MKRKRSYELCVVPYGADESGEAGEDSGSALDSLNEMLSGADEDTQGDSAGEDNQDEQDDAGQEEQQKQPQNKAEYAFAQMRAENAALLRLAKKVADATGIQYSTNKELLAAINEDALTKLAEKQNVPKALLERMEQLELSARVYEEQQMKEAALSGFQTLQDEFGLTADELKAFAKELDETDNNPFEKQLDVVKLYRDTHFEEIMQRRIDQAVQSALTKNNMVDQHSSTPNQHRGKNNDDPQSVSTVSGLNALLNGMN